MSPKVIAAKMTFWVVCDDYRSGPFSTEEAAQRSVDAIEKLGACTLPHRVEMTRETRR